MFEDFGVNFSLGNYYVIQNTLKIFPQSVYTVKGLGILEVKSKSQNVSLRYSYSLENFNDCLQDVLLNFVMYFNINTLYTIGKSPDYKATVLLIINVYNNLLFPWTGANLFSHYSVLQLQRIRNKAMQLN